MEEQLGLTTDTSTLVLMTSMVGSRIPHSLRQDCLSRHRSLQPELHMNADAAVCSSLQVQTNRNTDVLGQFGPLCCNVFGASQHTLAALFNRFFHSVKGSRWQEELITSLCRVCSSLYTSSPTWGHCCVITFPGKTFLLSFEID